MALVNINQLPDAEPLQGTDKIIVQQVETSKTSLDDVRAFVSGAASGDRILTGLSVSVSGLALTISAGSWQIANVIYTTIAATHITLADPDPDNNRIDLIYGNNAGAILVITGTASANPVKPSLPANSIEIGFVLVTPTGSSVGGGGAIWGSIAGTLSDQTDLQAVLDTIPDPYTLPIGGASLGGVKNGGNVTINGSGQMNATASAWGSITGTLSAQADLNTALGLKASTAAVALKADIAATAATGTALTFTIDKVFGSVGAPETGNVTGNVTGAQLGVTVLLIHNNGSTPSFDSKFKILSGSGDYVTGSVNYIFCQYLDATHIIYTISQSS